MTKVIKRPDIQVGDKFDLSVIYARQVSKGNNPAVLDAVIDFEADVVVSESFGQIDMAENLELLPQNIIELAKKHAEALLQDASNAVKDLKINAYKEIEEERKTSLSAGYAVGLKQAEAEVEQRTDAVLSELRQFCRELSLERTKMLSECEDQLYVFAVDIARKILRNELKQNDKALLGIYRDAVKEFTADEVIKLIMWDKEHFIGCHNPDKLIELAGKMRNVELIRVQDAPCGTFILESPRLIIDAGIDTQLSKVEEMIRLAKPKTEGSGV